MTQEPRVPASEVIFHYFVDKIKRGDLHPGDPIPSERTLQKQLGVSRFSLREGLARLNAVGVIDTQHGKTTRVSQQVSLDSLKNVFLPLQAKLDNKTRSDLYEARVVLEGELASLAAERRTSSDLNYLTGNLQMAKASLEDGQAFGLLDLEFHRLIAEAAGNRFLIQMHAVLRDQLGPIMKRHTHEAEQRKSILQSHENLYKAIESRKPIEAKAMSREHLSIFKSQYVQAHGQDR